MESSDRTTGEVAALGAAAGLAVTATGLSNESRSLLELRPVHVERDAWTDPIGP